MLKGISRIGGIHAVVPSGGCPSFAPLPRQRAYVVPLSNGFYQVVASAGNACGTFHAEPAYGWHSIARNGTFLVQRNACTFTWWPQAFH